MRPIYEFTNLMWLVTLAALGACGPASGGEAGAEPQAPATEVQSPTPDAGDLETIRQIDRDLLAVDSVFAPLPLMRPAEEEGLRRFGNDAQLAVARRIGVARLTPQEEIDRMERSGDLVRLAENRFWVIRDLDYSTPLAVPALENALVAIGENFQARLRELGAPPLRFEISSVLRSAVDQERLRAVNPNAALGESTHEYATTVDIAYNAFAAPVFDGSSGSEVADAYRTAAYERIAARRALEIKAQLAATLRELQDDGRVMVTLERLQPVFHLTVAQ